MGKKSIKMGQPGWLQTFKRELEKKLHKAAEKEIQRRNEQNEQNSDSEHK